ncbi:hypothetical protein AAG906_021305 [Vitis piasezkii]
MSSIEKALYGLKQAPCAWFQRFNSFLPTLGFSCSRADTSLFVFHQQSDIIYLLLYVDDIIITGNNSSLLDSFACKLNSEFATKDLGSFSYFLGLEATSTTDGLFISQLKYARDILTRVQLLDSKPVHTPMIVSHHLTSDGPTFSDPTLYRSLVGALQYLIITHPDIAHVVNSVSRFLHGPIMDHFLAVKRILHYVKGTLHFGLTFRLSMLPGALVAYSTLIGPLSRYSPFHLWLLYLSSCESKLPTSSPKVFLALSLTSFVPSFINNPIIKEQSSDHARQKKLLAALNDHIEASSFIDGVLMIEVLAHVPEVAPFGNFGLKMVDEIRVLMEKKEGVFCDIVGLENLLRGSPGRKVTTGVPRLLLDIGCGSGFNWFRYLESMLSVASMCDVDLLHEDMSRGLGLRPRVIEGANSISIVQWLCNVDKSSHEPR